MIKTVTFLIGLIVLLVGATLHLAIDWDIGVTLVMCTATYFTADYSVKSFRNLDWREIPGAIFWTWFSVDGVYTIYWFCRDREVLMLMRDVNWPVSLCLYLAAGTIWSLDNAKSLSDSTIPGDDLR